MKIMIKPSFDIRKVPVKFVSTTAFHPFNEISAAGLTNWPPPLFTRKSIFPNSLMVVETRACTWQSKGYITAQLYGEYNSSISQFNILFLASLFDSWKSDHECNLYWFYVKCLFPRVIYHFVLNVTHLVSMSIINWMVFS